jgi:hypothetical protein
MTLAKAKARANETFIGTGITYDHHLRSSLTIVTYDRQNIFIVQATGAYLHRRTLG